MKIAKRSTVADHQSDQTTNGDAFEKSNFKDLKRALEKAGLDAFYQLVQYGKFERMPVTLPDWLVSEARLRSNKTAIKPDLAIICRKSNRFVVFTGCKTSLRERHFGDERHSLYMRLCDDPLINQAKWIESFKREHDNDTRNQIITKRDSVYRDDIAIDFVTSQYIDPAEFSNEIIRILKEDMIR